MSEFVINLDDQYSLQNNPALHSQVQVDVDRDANPERRGTLMPSELVMGPGKPYKVHVAFKDPSRATRWRGKDVDKSGGAIAPWVGTNLQYTIVDSPNGEYDGMVFGEFIMTMVSEYNRTCSAQAFMQGVGMWDSKNAPRTNAEYIQRIEAIVARNPLMGAHTDWEGQEVIEEGDPRYDPQKASNGKFYLKIDGLNSWRAFPMAQGAPGTRPMPVPRIPILDKDGKETGRSYVASSRVVRRESVAGATGPGAQGGQFGQAQAPPNNPYGQQQPMSGVPNGMPVAPFGQPPAYPQAPQQQYAQPPQQYAQQPPNLNTAGLYQQTPAQFQTPVNPPPQQQYAPSPQQQSAYVPPQPMAPAPPNMAPQAPPQQPQQAPQGQGQAPQPQSATQGAPAWQQPGPSFR